MQSKISFFNRTIFWKNVRRFWPVWTGLTALWVICLIIPLSAEIAWNHVTSVYLGYNILETGSMASVFLTMLFSILTAMCVYAYLYSAKSTNMMASLPIRREELFLTSCFSGLVWLLAAPIVVGIVLVLISAAAGLFSGIFVSAVLQWLAITAMHTLLFYGLATLCATLTGNVFVLPAIYMIFNFVVAAAQFIITALLEPIVYGLDFSGGAPSLSFLSPIVKLLNGGFVCTTWDSYNNILLDFQYKDWTITAIYAAVGIVFIAAAVFICRKRRMELASDVIAVPALKPVFKYCMALGVSLVLAYMLGTILQELTDNSYWAIGFLLIGGFIGYFAAEMLLHKSFRIFRYWRGFAVYSLLIVALVAAINFDLFGYERYIPHTDKIQSVSVNAAGYSFTTDKDELIEDVTWIHQAIINDKTVNTSRRRSSIPSDYTNIRVSTRITYQLESGKEVERYYKVLVNPDTMGNAAGGIKQLEDLLNNREVKLLRATASMELEEFEFISGYINWWDEKGGDYSGNIKLTEAQVKELYNDCIVPDLMDTDLCKVNFLDESEGVYEGYYIQIDLVDAEEQFYDGYGAVDSAIYPEYFSYRPCKSSTRTNAYLESLGIVFPS